MITILLIEAGGTRYRETAQTLTEARRRARAYVTRHGSNPYKRQRTAAGTRYLHYEGDREAIVYDETADASC